MLEMIAVHIDNNINKPAYIRTIKGDISTSVIGPDGKRVYYTGKTVKNTVRKLLEKDKHGR